VVLDKKAGARLGLDVVHVSSKLADDEADKLLMNFEFVDKESLWQGKKLCGISRRLSLKMRVQMMMVNNDG